ncbi:hypothetical protein [Corynebacterium variabile]|uniref:hypothetical protein n=1 Tax=Corynebacterium variabile TaxID=1727 RepID=UPI0028A26347|nr:hypothetical protein [Corynebacterium variabile]
MTSSAGKITVFSVHPAPAILLAIVGREPAVQLNLGGSVALQIRTMAGERYNVILPANADALACRDAAIEVVGQPAQSAV